ncbi:hypothetical protein DYB32_008749 [Aphanomyces invadans]|uniref:Uncharacterized protein n=1 Tax=Aphanomyces invadans TaxID=157072 RepID=A0A3R7CUZ9_9STRA|nr:hypothetical protein DYB32_008749 [Aphanomyces invadans]
MMEKDILLCLNATATPPEDVNPRELFKDAQRIVVLAETHNRTLQQLFRHVIQDTPDDKVIYTKLVLHDKLCHVDSIDGLP